MPEQDVCRMGRWWWVVGVVVAGVLTTTTATAQMAGTPAAATFTRGDAWLTGGFVAATVIAMPFDERLAEWMQQPGRQGNGALKTGATVFRNLADPGTVVIAGGLYVAGLVSQNATMADVGFHSGEAIVASSAIGWAIKSVAGRARPRVDIHRPHDYKLGRGFGAAGDYQSFPSGHTLAAFSLAAAVSAESGERWPEHQMLIGVLTYGGATLSGLSRMYNNAHWASDVLLGAGIGTLTGRMVVRWQHGHPGNWLDKTFNHVTAVPAADGAMMIGWHGSW